MFWVAMLLLDDTVGGKALAKLEPLRSRATYRRQRAKASAMRMCKATLC
jgi:hypothetical protein